MEKQTKHSAAEKDNHNFPTRTGWTQIEQEKNSCLQSIQAYCWKLYQAPLRNYALGIAALDYPEFDLAEVEDWVMEFMEFELPAIIQAKSTRRPAKPNPLFRYMILAGFKRLARDKIKKAKRQKRWGHLRRAELVCKSSGTDERELEPVDNIHNTPDIEWDLRCLREYYLSAKVRARQEFAERKETAVFDVLIQAIEDRSAFATSELAKMLPSKSEGAIRTAKSRLQDRLGELLVECVARAEQIGLMEARKVLRDLFEISQSVNDATPTVLAPK